MGPTIIAITVSYYAFEWLLGFQGLSGVFDNHFNLVAMLPAGFVGGLQYAATRGRGLRWQNRLLLGLYGLIAIILAPTLLSLFFLLPSLLFGFGIGAVQILPTIMALTTFGAILAFVISFAFAVPTLFLGISLGQWLQFRRMRR